MKWLLCSLCKEGAKFMIEESARDVVHAWYDVLWRCCLKQCRKGVVEIRNLVPRVSTAHENHYEEIRPWSAIAFLH
uniref:Uncharacterized protein n=1 Tax=Trichuris muris TaxID=70415 RepID=A0A5S6QUM3_TRIMR